LKNKVPFNASNPRFTKDSNIIKTTKVGPGEYYDPSQTTWSKRTYNILFAEIWRFFKFVKREIL